LFREAPPRAAAAAAAAAAHAGRQTQHSRPVHTKSSLTIDDVSIFLTDPGLMTFRKRQRRWGCVCVCGVHVCVYVVCVRCIRERHERAPRQSTSTHSAVHTSTAAPSHARPHHLYARYHDKKRTCPSLSASANVLSSGKGSPSTDSIHCCTSFSARGVVHGRSIDVRESRWDGKGMDHSRSRSGHPIPNQFRSHPNIPTLGHSGPRPNTNQTRPPRHTHTHTRTHRAGHRTWGSL